MRRLLPVLALFALMLAAITAPASAEANHDLLEGPCQVLGAAILGPNQAHVDQYSAALQDGSVIAPPSPVPANRAVRSSPPAGVANGRYVTVDKLRISGPGSVVIGCSVEGRPIVANMVGYGPAWIAVIGGIHQGQEANTTLLVDFLHQFYEANPGEIPVGVGLAFIPNMNPDGAAAGTRENSRGVDLNRNWGIEWRLDTYTAYGVVKGGGGGAPYSEPETRTIRRFLDENYVDAVIFYHSRAGLVVAGNNGARSKEFAIAVANATGYDFASTWTSYPISGGAIAYFDTVGVSAIDVELMTHEEPEFKRNLKGIEAALDFVSDSAVRHWKLEAVTLRELGF